MDLPGAQFDALFHSSANPTYQQLALCNPHPNENQFRVLKAADHSKWPIDVLIALDLIGGYTTQFILFGSRQAQGTLRFVDSSGQALNILLR